MRNLPIVKRKTNCFFSTLPDAFPPPDKARPRSGSHFGKTLITDLAIEIVLIESLDDAVQFSDALHSLFQFSATVTKLPIEITLIFLSEQFHKVGLSFTHKGKHPVYLCQQNLLHLDIAYLVRSAFR